MTEDASAPGTLYVVATPIGHLDDMTYRAVDILKSVCLIAAEDTRHTGRLMARYQIDTRLTACHEHNETRKVPGILSRLRSGEDVALVSNAGTPCISDPGYRLVKAVSENGLPVVPIPGCNAAITGLSVSGLATDRFLFLGFLPKKSGKRRHVLSDHQSINATVIFYESPKRICDLISEILDAWGDQPACLAREMTKTHEEYLKGSLGRILSQLSGRASIKGECVLYVQSPAARFAVPDEAALASMIQERLATEDIGTSQLARELSQICNLPRKQVYDMILQNQNSEKSRDSG